MKLQSLLRFQFNFMRKRIALWRYDTKFGFSSNKDLSKIQEPEQMISEQLSQRQRVLKERHLVLQKGIDRQLPPQFPLKLYGISQQRYQRKFGFLPDRIMSYYQIHSRTITDYLLKIYKASLYAIADDNQGFMQEYWEEQLQKRVTIGIKSIKERGLVMKVKEERDFLSQITEQCDMVDAVMVRGLSADRKINKPPNQYRKSVQHQDVGLITYTPLHLTMDNQQFINPTTNKTIYQDYSKMVLRVLLRIRTPIILNVNELKLQSQVCTYEHLCIFQNEMVPPMQFKSSYKLETFMEWLGKYRFGIWRLADIDNSMKGNGLFPGVQDEEVEEVFKGTKLDKGHFINIRKF